MILKRGAILSPRRDRDIVIVEGAPGGDAQEEQADGRPPVQTRRVRTDLRPTRHDKSTGRNTKS